jgi:hypothetical protein
MVTLFDDVSFLHGVSGHVRALGWDGPKRSMLLWLDESNVPLVCRTQWADPELVSELVEFLRKAKDTNMLITTGVKYGFEGNTWFCAAMENKVVTARRKFESIYDQEDNWIQAEDQLAHVDDPYDATEAAWVKAEDDASRQSAIDDAILAESEAYDDWCVDQTEKLEQEAENKRLDEKIKKLEMELANAKLNCPEGYAIVPKVNGKSPYLAEFDSSSYEYDENAKDPLLALRQQRYQDEYVS